MQVEKVATLKGHSGCIYDLDLGPQAHQLFSGGSDKIIAQWNLETFEPEKFAAQMPEYLYEICFIPEKNLLLVGTSAGSIHIIDLNTNEEIKILQHHQGPIFELKYSLTSNCFYSAAVDGNFAVCSLDSLSLIKIRKLGDFKLRSIDFNYTNQEIAIACGNGDVRIFDMNILEEKKVFTAHRSAVNIVRYSPNDKLLLTGGKDAHLKSWNARTYKLIKSIPAHNFAIYDIAYSPDGSLFATASRDKTVKIWDANTFEILVRINKEKYDGHGNSVNKILWTKYQNYLISTGDDKEIMIWKITKKPSR